MLDKVNGRDTAERLYIVLQEFIAGLFSGFVPFVRRVQRFIFLPYCYFFLVNWTICSRSRFLVGLDFLYCFFVLKTFPDNYFRCRFWNRDKSEWLKYYGSNYDPYQRFKLRKEVLQKKHEVLYEDKILFEDLCLDRGVRVPETILYLGSGVNIKDKVDEYFSDGERYKFIVKPVDGKGGHGIYVSDDSGCTKDLNFISDCRCLIQRYIDQHSDLNAISESSNTIRIVSLMDEEGPFVIGAYIRFGLSSLGVDNISQGGVGVKVNIADGCLDEFGVDKYGNSISRHSESGVSFKNYQLPLWDEVIDFVADAHRKIPYAKLLGFDVAIENSGPILIEANTIYDNVGFESMCGPILAHSRVAKFYLANDLLVNKKQIEYCKKLLGVEA